MLCCLSKKESMKSSLFQPLEGKSKIFSSTESYLYCPSAIFHLIKFNLYEYYFSTHTVSANITNHKIFSFLCFFSSSSYFMLFPSITAWCLWEEWKFFEKTKLSRPFLLICIRQKVVTARDIYFILYRSVTLGAWHVNLTDEIFTVNFQ